MFHFSLNFFFFFVYSFVLNLLVSFPTKDVGRVNPMYQITPMTHASPMSPMHDTIILALDSGARQVSNTMGMSIRFSTISRDANCTSTKICTRTPYASRLICTHSVCTCSISWVFTCRPFYSVSILFLVCPISNTFILTIVECTPRSAVGWR